ncbi:hypothetical protein HDU96_003678 [Phlyctochytrium bullatum]|nr:hypothetical protein HDU96_003678 [Phlyctochytrium bullatum]
MAAVDITPAAAAVSAEAVVDIKGSDAFQRAIKDRILAYEQVLTMGEVEARKKELRAKANGDQPKETSTEATPKTEDERILNVLRRHNVPGFAMAVLGDGAVPIHYAAFGSRWTQAATAPADHPIRRTFLPDAWADKPIGKETLFQMASVSKPVACMVAMRLVEMGKIELDTDVNVQFERAGSSFRVGFVEGGEEKPSGVTPRRLMCHMAGTTVHGFMGYDRSDAAKGKVVVPDTVGVLEGKGNSSKVGVRLPPGITAVYSGGGTTMLQHLIEAVTGEPFAAVAETLILGPAGMTRSSFLPAPLPADDPASVSPSFLNDGDVATAHTLRLRPYRYGHCVHPELAAAGLWSSAEDMAKLLQNFWKSLNGGEGALTKESAEAMMARQGVEAEKGIGWALEVIEENGSVTFSHGGANCGYSLHAGCNARTGQGLVILINGPPQSPDVWHFMAAVSDAAEKFAGFVLPNRKKAADRVFPPANREKTLADVKLEEKGEKEEKPEDEEKAVGVAELAGRYVTETEGGEAFLGGVVEVAAVEGVEGEVVEVVFVDPKGKEDVRARFVRRAEAVKGDEDYNNPDEPEYDDDDDDEPMQREDEEREAEKKAAAEAEAEKKEEAATEPEKKEEKEAEPVKEDAPVAKGNPNRFVVLPPYKGWTLVVKEEVEKKEGEEDKKKLVLTIADEMKFVKKVDAAAVKEE